MGDIKISDSVIYIGADDRAIDLLKVSIRYRTEYLIIPM